MITQTFDLNLIPEQAPVVIHCDQYDHGTGRLIVKLYEGDVAYTPTGTATIQGRKPDGHGFDYAATLSGNTVTADLTAQMSAVAGRVRCQIVVTESTGRTGTFAFILEVQPSALPSDSEMSDSDYQLIEQAIEETQQAAEDAQNAAEDAEAWAVGERGGVPVGPTDPTYENNAEYYAGQAAIYAQGALKYKGSIPFASIPTTGLSGGDMYNITDDFTTDNRFVEGSGKFCPAGTNIAWVAASSKWDVLAIMKIGSLDDLTDVTIAAPTNNQVLTYDSNAGKWVNANAQSSVSDLDDLTDVTITTPVDQQVLTYDSNSGEWINANAQGGVTQLDQLSDVTISAPTDGQSLVYDSNAGEWVNGSGGGGSSTLSGLTDVDITTPTDGQALLYDANSGDWVNGNAGGGDYMGLYGMTEIQSSDGQGTTLLDLNQFTSVGNYYCDGKAYISTPHYMEIGLASTTTGAHYNAKFLLYVRTLPSSWLMQDLYLIHSTNVKRVIHYQRHAFYENGAWTFDLWRANVDTGSISPDISPYSLGNGMYNVLVNNIADGDVLTRVSGKWSNKPLWQSLTSIYTTGATNTTGSTITAGTYFYLEGVLVRAKADIANGATFTLNTNYEVVTAGALNNNPLKWKLLGSKTGGAGLSLPTEDYTELLVEVRYMVSATSSVDFVNIIRKELIGNAISIGGYLALGISSSGGALVNKSATTIKANQVFVNGASVVSSATMTVYYR